MSTPGELFGVVEELSRPVDAVVGRADALRSPDRPASRRADLELLVRCCDLTTLEGSDTADKVRELSSRARAPAPSVPAVAAVCVYPRLVPVAVDALAGSAVRVASVAGSFPSAQSPLDVRLSEIRHAASEGAHELDVPINRGLFLEGDHRGVFDEVRSFRDAAAGCVLKVILETGDLASLDDMRRAALIALAGGADFVKSSTGKIPSGATIESAIVMADAVEDFAAATGRRAGLKMAGGIRSAGAALAYVDVVRGSLGSDWLDPARFRVGASSLLSDLVTHLVSPGDV